jgi:concanavalin A-like lectin/glucanase superfamily protein
MTSWTHIEMARAKRAWTRPMVLGMLGCLLLSLLLTTPTSGQEARYSWQRPHAKVLDTGDLEWAPEPFVYEAGPSVRYIDFADGNDGADGLTPRTAWKHHPWDPNASDSPAGCRGAHTYVFKRGVIYRGELIADESGTAETPIRLTSDPAWGAGEAVISGSEEVAGWTRGAEHADIPEGEKVWRAEVGFLPRCAWMVDADGKVTRLRLARTPNWNVSNPEDIKSEWWYWEQPRSWEVEYKTQGVDGKVLLGIDTKHLTREPEYYLGAVVWSEWGVVMGTPYPTRVEAVDTERKGIGFQGPYYEDSDTIRTGHRYCLEDKPHYLDEPGEFWFRRDGDLRSGTLYVRLPHDVAPSRARVEAASRINLIDSRGISHLRISGLTFRFTNVYWDYTLRNRAPDGFPRHQDVDSACVRILGAGEDIEIANCRFEHVTKAVRMRAGDGDHIDRVVIRDNDIRHLDRSAIEVKNSAQWGKYKPPYGTLGDVRVLRNRIHHTGQRPYRRGFAHTLVLGHPDTAEVAGNILTRVAGAGVYVFGGKEGGTFDARPFSRILIHHNKVEDSLLDTNDWGGIETWQGGPFYVYCNISGNPGGFWHWKYLNAKTFARLGFAYYLDGSFKNYVFNNIAWGKTSDPTSQMMAQCAFYEAVPTVLNAWFNNTVYNFRQGSNWSPSGGYHRYMGNVWSNINSWVFQHGRLKEDRPGEQKEEYPHHTNAFTGNVFHNTGERFGHFERNVRQHKSPESFRDALRERGAMAWDLGVTTKEQPLRDPARHDFRLAQGSAAIDRGVQMFVPWSIYGTVGEWHFHHAGDDPSTILDEHWYMAEYVMDRHTYQRERRFPLKVANVDASSYRGGPLEDWIDGALALNGRDQYAIALHVPMTAPLHLKRRVGYSPNQEDYERTFTGAEIKTPDIHNSNLLIEVYFRAEPDHGEAVLVEKLAGAGYSLTLSAQGELRFRVDGKGASAQVTSDTSVADGKWHHAIVELDRNTASLRMYLDGRARARADGLGPDVSLSNPSDLHVGGTPTGRCLRGAIEFVRIAHGTLADSKTTIEELYAWEFDGPQYRDFTGRPPTGKRHDAGALELIP